MAGAAQVRWPDLQRAAAEAVAVEPTFIHLEGALRDKAMPAALWRVPLTQAVAAVLVAREALGLRAQKPAMVALAPQVQSLARLPITAAVEAEVPAPRVPVVLAVVVLGLHQPAMPEQLILAEAAVAVVPHPARTGQVARVAQAS